MLAIAHAMSARIGMNGVCRPNRCRDGLAIDRMMILSTRALPGAPKNPASSGVTHRLVDGRKTSFAG